MKDNYSLYGKISIGIAGILYLIKYIFIINDKDYYMGYNKIAANVNYIELLLWIFFFLTLGTQLIIIGIIKKK